MPKTQSSNATVSGKAPVVAAGSVCRLKVRLAKRARRVTMDGMDRAIAAPRARIGQS
jgi:hypothetical protein